MTRLFNPRWGLHAAAICCLAIVAGCAPSMSDRDTAPITEMAYGQAHGDITVWSWNIAAKSLQAMIPAFERANPGVKANVDMTGARMSTRFMLSLAAGTGAPDVSQLQMTDAPHYIATGRLADLTPVAGKYRSMFPPSLWDNCTMNGRVYAIPWDMGPCGVYYKRDVFKKYGIAPEKIETWDDYIEAGKQIASKSGGRTKMLPLASNDLNSLFELLIQQTGGQIFDDEGRVAIDSPQCRQALEIIRHVREAGITADVPAWGQEWMAGFNDETIATYPSAVWLGGTLKDTVNDYTGKKAEWGVFRLPAVERGGLHVSNLGGSVLVIPAQCKNKEAAWAFIEYALCTKEGQLAQYKSFDLFPAFLPALATPQMAEPDPFFGGQRVSKLFATDVTRIRRLNRTKNWAEAAGYMSQDFSHWASVGMPENGLLGSLQRKLSRRLDVGEAPKGVARR